jgi:universal stress protein E
MVASAGARYAAAEVKLNQPRTLPMASFQLRKILVAVANPSAGSNKAVSRAASLAHKTGASLELFNSIPTPQIALGYAAAAVAEGVRAVAAQNRADLERIANRLRREELLVETVVQTGYAVHEAILRQALLAQADLIVIEAHRHNRLARLLLSQTDFELIRRTPVPLLIVKGSRPWRGPRILAALDPLHAHDKPAALDAQIVEAAAAVAAVVGGTLHLTHVCRPLVELFPGVVMEATILTVTPEQEKAYEAGVRRQFYKAIGPYSVSPKRRHFLRGDPATELPSLARSLKAGMVVMGAVSRSGLKRMFIGHTAEHVLDALSCDVLIVKPPELRAAKS